MPLLAASILCLLTQGAQDAATIRRIPKAGDGMVYVRTLDIKGSTIQLKVRIKAEVKVAGVNPDGTYIEEEKTLEHKFIQDGKETDGPDVSATIAYDPSGRIISMSGTQKVGDDTYQFASLRLLVAPPQVVKVGETWAVETPAGPGTGGAAVSSTYTLMDAQPLDGAPAWHVSFKTQVGSPADGPMSEGETWLRQSDGVLLKLKAKLSRIPLAGELLSIDYLAVAAKP